MGDIGSRMLSKALQINKRLCIIYWDHNGTSPNGFQDIAAALEKLVHMLISARSRYPMACTRVQDNITLK